MGTDEQAVRTAAIVLAEGKLVAIPTETVYGLAADATNGEAVASIFEAKGRPHFNPLICHVSDVSMAERYAVIDPQSRRLIDAFWPGPLTLVLPLKADTAIHPLVAAGLDTIALRMPRGVAGKIIAALDRPLAAPSANTSGKISGTSAPAVEDDLGARIALILDAGPSEVGLESTIVKVDGDAVQLLRPGGLAAEDIEAFIGKKLERIDQRSAIEAPGMLASHYAPAAGVRLNVHEVREGEALLAFGPVRASGAALAAASLNLSEAGNLREAAANLFDYMKRLDRLGSAVIAVEPIPFNGLGEAINDRLVRAAAPRIPSMTVEQIK
ncbi:L-threonylcarbamoyladenylate synthase [Phyllobacterium sp. A18/5-2]|uniref:Threonylcarbamoyl-AMP synthase n=2 Tax=Phyllobacteriaceae TaxID=69277 RepID=A0A2P7B490_9HYPH|nr:MULTISPECIES: L-threonylcarbamoyladenylate synthase [Phyllobacterium]PSH61271.1 threonylcarbamoyl-AMP synthase [Phyllobacterium sophorae]UXN65858.1 L-threonylcarbamoyladenylate synthase [Phyllobacterium sp. A18/5-2]